MIPYHYLSEIRDGTTVENHGYKQCVAVFNRYQEGVRGLPFVPVDSAFELWTRFADLPQLHDHYRRSSTPVAGSIFVCKPTPGNPDGHTGLVTRVNPDGTLETVEQNMEHAPAWHYTRPAADPLRYGYLIPTPTNPAKPTPKDEPMTNEEMRKLADMILDTKVPQAGSKAEKGAYKTLREVIAWTDHQAAAIKRGVEDDAAQLKATEDRIVSRVVDEIRRVGLDPSTPVAP